MAISVVAHQLDKLIEHRKTKKPVALHQAFLFLVRMIYEQTAPKEAISKIVKSFWLIDSQGDDTIHKEKVIPDGYPELIFHYGDQYKINIKGVWELQSKSIIAGQIKNFFYLENTGTSKMFAIKFQPWVLTEFFGIDMSSITDQVIEIPKNIFSVLQPIKTIAISNDSFQKKVHQIEHWFFTFLETRSFEMSEKHKVVGAIISNKGNIPLKEIQQEFNINERTLERYFKTYIGLSPKFYSRVIRFSYIFQLIQNDTVDWADIVYRAGYYDQSHFIKNFKEFTGEDPSKYGFSSKTMANFFLKK